MFSLLCGALLLVGCVQEVRAESATQAWSPPDKTPGSVFESASRDLADFGRAAATPDFWRTALLIGGVSLASAVADKPLDRFAANHGKSGIMTGVERMGNALPFVAIAYSGTMFLASDPDSKPAGTAYTALAAGGVRPASLR